MEGGGGCIRRGGEGGGGPKNVCTKNDPTRLSQWTMSLFPTMVTFVCVGGGGGGSKGRGGGGLKDPPTHAKPPARPKLKKKTLLEGEMRL